MSKVKVERICSDSEVDGHPNLVDNVNQYIDNRSIDVINLTFMLEEVGDTYWKSTVCYLSYKEKDNE